MYYENTNWIKELEGSCTIRIIVQPNAKKNEFGEIFDDCLKLKITSPPIDGKANQMVTKFLASFFSLKKNDIKILQGEQNRRKVISIQGLDKQTIIKYLNDKT